MSPNTESNQGGNGSKYIRDSSLEQEVKDAIQQAAVEMGEPLSRQEYLNWREEHENDAPTVQTAAHRLSLNTTSWERVCKTAGVVGRVQQYTTAEVEDALQQAADVMDEPLLIEEYQSWREDQESNHPSSHTIMQRCGGWTAACESSGVEARSNNDHLFTDVELETALQRAADEAGEPLRMRDYDTWREGKTKNYPTSHTIQRRAGGGRWSGACRSGGVTPGKKGKNVGDTVWPTTDLETALKQAADDLGVPLKSSEYRVWRDEQSGSYPSTDPIITRLGDGSWREACRAAGVEPSD